MTAVPRRAALRSAALVAVGAAATACTGPVGSDPSSAQASPVAPDHEVALRRDAPATTLLGSDEPTTTASRALLARSTAVVVSTTDADPLAAADAAARHLGIPLLAVGPSLAAELDRLEARTVIRYGSTPTAASASPDALGGREVIDGGTVADLPELPGLPRTPATGSALVLLAQGQAPPASIAPIVAAAGGAATSVADADPRRDVSARKALTAGPEAPVLAVGDTFGPSDRLARRVRTARRATDLPGGGLLPFPDRRMVALYGHPQTAALGMLGEQPPAEAAERASALARRYAPLSEQAVVPAFELIATIAASSATSDGSYSRKTPVEVLLPYVEAAEDAGAYVVLDLQPGRTDFLAQAKLYESLLRRPWVGLALDPEWRLKPDQKHLEQIGSVGIDEVNEVGAWLAELVLAHDLPPKVLTLHQFRTSMVRERERLDTSLDEIQWLVHVDGQGGQGAKQATWRALQQDLPEGVWLGWKNFEDEDSPMLTPEQTMARVEPTPWFISYQ